jgi:hypothetical protein
MAMERPYYAVDIVSAEDLRPNVYIFETKTMAGEVDKIITQYERVLKDWNEKQIIPKFEANPNVPWTSNPEYAPYSLDWIEATDEQVMGKLKELKLI